MDKNEKDIKKLFELKKQFGKIKIPNFETMQGEIIGFQIRNKIEKILIYLDRVEKNSLRKV